jgi:hypothetical protein
MDGLSTKNFIIQAVYDGHESPCPIVRVRKSQRNCIYCMHVGDAKRKEEGVGILNLWENTTDESKGKNKHLKTCAVNLRAEKEFS